MTPDKERRLQEQCAAFKRIQGLNRLYTILQCVLDLVMLGGMMLTLIVSHRPYTMLVIGVISVKLMLVFLLKGNRGNLAGLAATLAYLPLLAHFELTDPSSVGIIILIIMMHLFRILPCGAAERIKVLYGAPGFNGFILADELGKDQGLMETVLDRYNEVSRDLLVGSAIKENALPKALRAIKPAGTLMLVGGICLLMAASGLKRDMNSAEELPTGEGFSGKTVKIVTDRIYWQIGEGSFDSYWCKVGGRAVNVNVYDRDSREKFRELCLYCEASTEAETAWLSGESVGEGSSEPVSFIAEVKPYTKYTAVRPSKNSKEHIDDAAEIVEGYYLDVVDPHRAEQQLDCGMILTIVGAALIGLFYTMFFISRYKIETL